MDALVNEIIRLRPQTCEKVQIITHSSGSNSALVAAGDPNLNLSARVGNIVTIAPCLIQELDKFWLLAKDLPTIYAFYAQLANSGIYNLFGNVTDPSVEAFCNSGPTSVNTAICLTYIRPAESNPLLRQTSLRDFWHTSQNGSKNQFRPYEEEITTLIGTDLSYPLDTISIPVAAILSQQDSQCLSPIN